MVRLPLGKPWGACTHVHRRSRTEVAGRLEYFALLSVVQRYGFDIVKGELSEVDLSVLGVTEFHPVIHHACMVGTHRTHVDGLDASHTSVILDLHSRKVAERIRHGLRV